MEHSSAMSIKMFYGIINHTPTIQQIRTSCGLPKKVKDKHIKEFCDMEGLAIKKATE